MTVVESSVPRASARRSFLRASALLAAPALWLAGGRAAKAEVPRNPAARRVFRSIRDHENDHVDYLVLALGDLARPKPTFQGLEQAKYRDFVLVSQALENTGVGAYLGAAPAILDAGILAAAGSIATVEARHAGVLNVFLDAPVTVGNESFESPLTAPDVVAAAGGFIAHLNGGPPVDYSDTPSADNDVAILNFALALEYLEAEFYNINFPRFFA